MIKIYFSRFFSLFLSFVLLIAPLPVSAMGQDIAIHLSEASSGDNDINASYVYLGKDSSNIAELISDISDLDDQVNSPLRELTEYIKQGFLFAEYNVVITTLEYAASVMQKKQFSLDPMYVDSIANQLKRGIHQIIHGELTIPSGLPFVALAKEGAITRNSHLRTLVVNENMDVLGKSVFYKHMKTKQGIHVLGKLKVDKNAKFKKNVTINGTLSAADAIIGSISIADVVVGDLTVTGTTQLTAFTSPGVIHNDASGLLSSSLIVDADITTATITNDKLANISSDDIPGDIVLRDGSGNFATHMITIDGTPVNPTDVATVAFVQSSAVPLNPKIPAVAVSISNESLTGFPTIDGVTFPSGTNRVLLTAQTNPVENGLWVVAAGAWTRPSDFATGTEAGTAYVLILEGTVYADSSWLCSTPAAIIDTDPITFVLFSLTSAATGANEGIGTGSVFDTTIGNTLFFRSLKANDAYMSIVTNGTTIDISTNATSSDTAGTIVARDNNGNFSANTVSFNDAVIGNISITNISIDTLSVVNEAISGTLSVNNEIATNLTATLLSASDAIITNGTVTNFSSTDAVIQTLTVANCITNLCVNNLSVVNESISGTLSVNNEIINGNLTIPALTPAGVVHNNVSGNLSSSLIVNADVDPNAAIIDTKLATLVTSGKVANSATTATSADTPSTIVLRDVNGNFSANSVSFNDAVIGNLTITTPITNLTITTLSVVNEAISGALSVTNEVINGTLQIALLTPAGILHNDASGNITSSLIVNADISATAAITDSKLATISTAGKVANSATTATSADTDNAIVARDPSGNFSANTITASLNGNATTATTATTFSGSLSGDVTGTQSATVVSFVGGQTAANVAAATILANAATSLDTANAIVRRDGTGSFAAQEISMVDGIHSGNLVLSIATSTSTTGNVLKGSNRFIHNFGTNNTFMGVNAGNFTTSGPGGNSALGVNALTANTTGAFNTAMGYQTLAANIFGVDNTAVGYNALLVNITGTDNTAIGYNALTANATGTSFNTAVGSSTLVANTSGSNNTAIGYQALAANITGSNNIALGYQAGTVLTSGNDNIYINAPAGSVSESSTTRIGTSQTSCFIAGINITGVSGDAVSIASNGQLGITFSSRRFKHDIEDMGECSENIFKLRPVTFVYNNDESNTQEFGLIAEEVDHYFPAIVAKDKEGVPYTVRYHLLPVLLLNELQKQHAIIQQQQAAIEEMQASQVTVEDMNNAIARLKEEIREYVSTTIA